MSNKSNNRKGTDVSGTGDILGLGKLGFNVKTANPSDRCPEGYYWVQSYNTGGIFGHHVQGHCRKAGSIEQMQEQAYQNKLKRQQMKEEYRLKKKEVKLREKKGR